MTENPSPETLVGAPLEVAANGGGTVESPALTLAELNKQLGSDFKDPSTALKALKDTKDFVGKRREDYINEMKQSVVSAPPDVATKSDVQALKNQLFFSENPQYKGYESLITKLGSNPADVVGSQDFKSVFEKAQKADEVENTKSVVSSNARLSQARSVTEEAVGIANARGTTIEDVALTFSRAINNQNNT